MNTLHPRPHLGSPSTHPASPAQVTIALTDHAQNELESVQQNVSSRRHGRQALLVVVASFLLTFTGCGLNFAFGVYQELYESMGGPFENATPAQIDLIGTLGVSLMTIGAPFASAWTKSYSPRTITFCGAITFALANILASFGQSLWHFILTQGFLLGCAACLSYIPAVTVAPGWFTRHRGVAMGIILSGTGVGGVAWAPTLRALNTKIGFRNTLRLTGGLSFLLIALSGFILKWDPDSARRNQAEYQARLNSNSSHGSRSRLLPPLVDWRIVRTRKFAAQSLSAALQSAAYYTPVYFFSTYARTLGFSAVAGANFISLSNGSSAAGKVAIGFLADRYGRIDVLLAATLISAVAVLGLWLPSSITGAEEAGSSKALFAAFAVLYGIFAGAYVSLFPTTLVELFGVQHFASVNGLLYMMRGLATLVGTPAAGVLIRGAREGIRSSMAYLASTILVGGLLAGATGGVLWVRFEARKGMN